MSNDPLSSGQRALLDGLAELDDLALGHVEPAASFRPVSWASGAPVSFDLRAICSASPPAATGAVHETVPGVADSLPPACPEATAIVAAVATGERSAAEIAEQSLARAEACNPALNALITLTGERAREEANTVDEVLAAGERPRPLSGIPIVHKDVIATRKIRTTAGSALLADYVPAHDATVVGRLSNAGTVMIGKANTHEFATGTTGASHFGMARNPWNLEHITGGSSSGSAAALAAGLVAGATGTDTGGSIRIPSACCGVVGLKPTYGRVSRHGVMPFAYGLDHVGPMARNVADVALLLTAMAGPDPFDPASASEPAPDFSTGLDAGVQGLRIAVPDFRFLELATEPVGHAVREAAAVLEGLGATLVDVEMPGELALVGPATIAMFLAEGGAVHRATLAAHPDAYREETVAFLSLSRHVTADMYLQAQRLRALLGAELARLFQSVDVLVTPTLATTAPPADSREVEGIGSYAGEGVSMDVRAALTLFTRPFNLTGFPAMSLPCGFHDELPIGLQLAGRPFDEATLLRAGAAYQSATDWHTRRPAAFGAP